MFTAQDVAKLRSETGVGIMDAKKALTEANGDFDKAREIVAAKYAEKAAKKADRETFEGLIGTYVHNGKLGVMVALACETDFVARNEDFKELAQNLALHIAAMVPEGSSIEEVLETQYIKDPSLTIRDLIQSKIATIGENIQLKSFTRITL